MLLLAPLLAAGAYHAALNLSGEVALLYHYDERGREYMTPVWLTRERGDLFVRANDSQRKWLQRIRDNPEVSLGHAGGRDHFEAIIEPHRLELVNLRMAQSYGWGEWLLSQLEDRSSAVPVRLALP
jgi:hypothetical protein